MRGVFPTHWKMENKLQKIEDWGTCETRQTERYKSQATVMLSVTSGMILDHATLKKKAVLHLVTCESLETTST